MDYLAPRSIMIQTQCLQTATSGTNNNNNNNNNHTSSKSSKISFSVASLLRASSPAVKDERPASRDSADPDHDHLPPRPDSQEYKDYKERDTSQDDEPELHVATDDDEDHGSPSPSPCEMTTDSNDHVDDAPATPINLSSSTTNTVTLFENSHERQAAFSVDGLLRAPHIGQIAQLDAETAAALRLPEGFPAAMLPPQLAPWAAQAAALTAGTFPWLPQRPFSPSK